MPRPLSARGAATVLATIDNVLRLHDEVGLDISVISNSGHYLKEYIPRGAAGDPREPTSTSPPLRDQHQGRVVALASRDPGRRRRAPARARARGRSRTTCAAC